MCLNRDLFSTYEPCNGRIILIGNNVICDVIGKGTMQIKMYNGIMRALINARHVLDLKKNLISLDTLEAPECKYTIENDVMKVFKSVLVVMKTCRSSSLFFL